MGMVRVGATSSALEYAYGKWAAYTLFHPGGAGVVNNVSCVPYFAALGCVNFPRSHDVVPPGPNDPRQGRVLAPLCPLCLPVLLQYPRLCQICPDERFHCDFAVLVDTRSECDAYGISLPSFDFLRDGEPCLVRSVLSFPI